MKHLILAFLFIVATPAFADEYYRRNIPAQRFAGADQGNVGSCQSEADTAALESVFYEKGLPVRLSAFYMHQRIFQKRIEEATSEEKKSEHRISGMVRYNSEDIALLNRMGDIVPYYMLPDDTVGYRPQQTGVRPHLSKILAPDADFKPVAVSRHYFTFLPGFKNSTNLDQLKANLKAGNAVTLSYDSKILYLMDHRTGLLKKEVGLKDIPYNIPKHASAIVGFDDSLYADRGFPVAGAIIIRNSWNDEMYRNAAMGYEKLDEKTLAEVAQMRKKISQGVNLPGYYAIPYAFFHDVIGRYASNKNINLAFTILQTDYAGFADQYKRLAANYDVVMAPYSCGIDSDSYIPEDSVAKSMIREMGGIMAARKAGRKISASDERELKKYIRLQLSPRNDDLEQFHFAFFSKHAKTGVDRARDFYSGAYNDYYCFPGRGEEYNKPEYLYPDLGMYVNSKFRQSLDYLADDFRSPANWLSFLLTLFERETGQ